MSITLLLGKTTVPVQRETGETGELTVNQFRLRDYPEAFRLLDDEIGLAGKACGQSRQQMETLTPESFEHVLAQVREVNAQGFFTFASRQLEKSAGTLRNLPPALVERIFAGIKPVSPPPSSIVPPPAA